jgi:cytochrome c peroxidase
MPSDAAAATQATPAARIARCGRAVRVLGFAAGLAWLTPTLAAGSLAKEPILPLQPPANLDARRVALGDRLFHDTRLSHDDTVSCASCHVLATGGADGKRVSQGVGASAGSVNAPTVFNSSVNLAQFWDGRSATLEEQVDGPVHHPAEMASNWPEVIATLSKERALVDAFRRAYPEGLSPANVRDAIASFERSLITVEAPFDRYLRGERAALNPQAERGYRWFKAYGCTACHQGAAVGGNMYQQMGAMGNYFADRGGLTKADLGRFNVTGEDQDRHVFKVPSLRLAVLTAPYFHDGSARTLDDAIVMMARYQLGREIPPDRRQDIAAFLASLVGRHPRLDAR